jgi:uncharacterized membrane protein YhaH (DUF805 family)
MNFDFNRLYLTADGRIGRQDYWIGAIALGIASIVVTLIISAIFPTTAERIVLFIWQLAISYPAYNLLAKRFQDRDKPAMYAAIVVGIFILISLLTAFGATGDPLAPNALAMIFGLVALAVGIWILVECGILRGTVGQNQFGPDPVAT